MDRPLLACCSIVFDMEIRHNTTSKHLLKLLNSPEAIPKNIAKMNQNSFLQAGLIPSRDDWNVLGSTEVSRILRVLVDEWIETGILNDGSESPSGRNLHKTTRAKSAILAYLAEHPPEFCLDRSGSDLDIVIGESLKVSTDWRSFLQIRRDDAHELFVSMFVSDWQNYVCRCRYVPCSKYFMMARPRASYKHGVFCCRKHQMHASATMCYRNRRTQTKLDMVSLAARSLLRRANLRDDWYTDDVVKRRVAADVSLELARNPNLSARQSSVTVRWVTRHWDEIETIRASYRKN